MSAELFDALIATTLAGSLAIVGVLVARAPVRRWFGAQTVYALWIAVPLIAFAMLLPAPLRPGATILHFARASAATQVASMVERAPLDLHGVLLLVWAAGVLLMTAWLVLQQFRYVRGLGRLRHLDGRIVQSESNLGGPALVGALRPRIVVPFDFAQRYVAGERELILAHEKTHLARGDARFNAFVAALRCCHWFNPLVHVAAAKFRFDQELACDAAVIARFPEARRVYANAMLKTQLAEQSLQDVRLPVGCRWPSGHPLKERIAMLKKPLPSRARRAIGVLLVATFALGGGYVAWASQSSRPPPVAATPGSQIDALFAISVDGGPPTRSRMVNPVGSSFAITNAGKNPWSGEFTGRPLEGGQI